MVFEVNDVRRTGKIMMRGMVIFACVWMALLLGGYLAANKWAIRHEALSFMDADRYRLVEVADPGVVPDRYMGADIVQTDAQHTDMSDRGPDAVKESIEQTLDKFLEKTGAPAPVAGTDAERPVTR